MDNEDLIRNELASIKSDGGQKGEKLQMSFMQESSNDMVNQNHRKGTDISSHAADQTPSEKNDGKDGKSSEPTSWEEI